MSRTFGPIFQMGYIVRDLDEAVNHWTNVLGVGPFFVTPLSFEHYEFEGIASSPELRLGFSYSGDMQIELIEQVNDAPSGYKSWLEEHGPGLHHVAMLLHDFDTQTAAFEASGLRVIMDGKTTATASRDSVRFRFYDTALHNGAYVEAVDAKATRLAVPNPMHEAAANWDGSNPVRPIG
jgi:hypothetical protein